MDIDKNAKKIWEYMQMHMPLKKADAIFVLCSHDTQVADWAAKTYKEGWAPLIILSGGAGNISQNIFDKPEAEVYKDILLRCGIPADKIITETKSRNTGENILFVHDLLSSMDMHINSFILVQKPYMERRTFATFKKQWPDKTAEIVVTSPSMSYEEYTSSKIVDKDTAINIMVGDMQRIREYPKLGFQIEQEIPISVWEAFEYLVSMGYNKRLAQ